MPQSLNEFRHDIKSPLTSAIISCEYLSKLLKKGSESNSLEINEVIQDINESLEYISDLVNGTDQKAGNLNVCDEINKSISVIRREEIGIRIDCDDKIIVLGDAVKFRRVISNLLINAVESFDGLARDDGGYIGIRVRHCKPGEVIITIEDNGCGIPKNKLDQVFEKGYSRKGSSGLGLYICKSIIEKDFGGKISVRSETGSKHGTEFRIGVAPTKVGATPI